MPEEEGQLVVPGPPEDRRRKVGAVLWPLILVVFFVLIVFALFWWWPRRFRRRDPYPLMPRTGLKQIYLACWQYLNFWGELPSEARGEAEALYKLRGNLPLQEPGYAYYDLPTEKGKDVTGPCRYDEKTERVVGCDFEYLNEPIIDDDCVLLATQWWVSKTERWFITERGDRGVWRVPGPGDRTRLVGRIYDRKTGALLPPKAPMKEEDAEHLPTTPSSP